MPCAGPHAAGRGSHGCWKATCPGILGLEPRTYVYALEMRPLICRAGSKYALADKIISMIPQHRLYVEPFFGGGGVFFKKTPSRREVINDIDKCIVEPHRLVRRVSRRTSDFAQLTTLPKMKEFMRRHSSSLEDKLVRHIIYFCNSWGSRGNSNPRKATRPMLRTDKIADYKERLRNVKIHQSDYKPILKKYDGKSTFFFLDPPYEEDRTDIGYRKHGTLGKRGVDLAELAKILKRLKGSFLLCINDSAFTKHTFRHFDMRRVKVQGRLRHGLRSELLISNYRLPQPRRTAS
jgi:DNA adenine methylase